MTEGLEKRLAKFCRSIMHEVWDGSCDIDASAAQDSAEKLRLIKPVTYDPAQHGRIDEADPGDTIFVFTDEMKALFR